MNKKIEYAKLQLLENVVNQTENNHLYLELKFYIKDEKHPTYSLICPSFI